MFCFYQHLCLEITEKCSTTVKNKVLVLLYRWKTDTVLAQDFVLLGTLFIFSGIRKHVL